MPLPQTGILALAYLGFDLAPDAGAEPLIAAAATTSCRRVDLDDCRAGRRGVPRRRAPRLVLHRDLDLTGFIDGTNNPSLSVAPSKVLVPSGRPGGSLLLLQKWGARERRVGESADR